MAGSPRNAPKWSRNDLPESRPSAEIGDFLIPWRPVVGPARWKSRFRQTMCSWTPGEFRPCSDLHGTVNTEQAFMNTQTLAWRNPGRKNLNFWCDPGRFWEVPGGFRRDSWGGLRPPRPPHMVVCTPTTPFLDFGVYFFVILGTIFRHFRHFCRQKLKII